MIKSLFIFRRDLRLYDNTSLIECCKKSDVVHCIFIMTPEQLKHNSYKSDSSIQFMHESLHDLNIQLNNKLSFFYGNTSDIIKKIIPGNYDNLYVTTDYTYYSKLRDDNIRKICKKYNIKFFSIEDHMLNNYNSVKTSNNKIYSIFTPYYNKAKNIKVRLPLKFNLHNKIKQLKHNDVVNLGFITNFYNYKKSNYKGGRNMALRRLNIDIKNYSKMRNFLSYETSRLSPYIKYGCLSIREVYHNFKYNIDFVRQLYWHDFYTTLGYKDIEFTKKRLYQPKQNIKWLNSEFWYQWKNGLTGFPVVDAAMRQLNSVNYCHNRGRLIASGFIKFMFMDWKIAEKYYATKLQDYSPFSNYYNWNWSMSFGPFSTPYFRIMNFSTQGKKFDKDCEYIKKWIPELNNVEKKHIHNWDKYYHLYPNVNYPKPIVDYKKQRNICNTHYKKIFS